ncbi:hypothetical protein SAMN04489712_10776 [Thermomonospora echinospora]|uniref:YtxH domain-containing protein n=1 Tax=Thermomonospora echinospora TaxID=1992 RepID=A0A1H6BFL0_9ACTN|nr:YtxH domain-containing protein [Thermomonospora echinospora]SEG59548.1 hypothetical protein SAMN04489712_10776 [Thermomonospora echinospora]
MKMRIPFIAGAAVGYVLGTKAGRERYEQIVQQSRKLAENPRVQETAGVLRAKSGELAGTAKQKAGDARHKMGGKRHAEHGERAEHGGPQTRTETGGGFAKTSAEATGTGTPTETGTPSGTGAPSSSSRMH